MFATRVQEHKKLQVLKLIKDNQMKHQGKIHLKPSPDFHYKQKGHRLIYDLFVCQAVFMPVTSCRLV
ncbi:hypothetical protein FA947_01185 [Mycoplasmoides pneumoniae]|nr:hypothetical protein FA947_01185 [Mycoplasmoides pneumoniae]